MKKVKKLISVLVCMAMLCAVLPAAAADDEGTSDQNSGVDETITDASIENLITNGDFATGDTTGWENRIGTDIDGATVEYDPEIQGNAMIIETKGKTSAQSIGTIWTVETGKRYTLSFDIGGSKPEKTNYQYNKITDSYTIATSNGVSNRTCAGNDLVAFGEEMTDDGKWNHFEKTFVAKTNTVYIQSSWAAGNMKFANFKLYEVESEKIGGKYYYESKDNVIAESEDMNAYPGYSIFNDANGEKYYITDESLENYEEIDGVAYIALEKLGNVFTVQNGFIWNGYLDDEKKYPASQNFAAYNFGTEGTYDRIGIAVLTADPSYIEYHLSGEKSYKVDNVKTTFWAISYEDYLMLDLSDIDALTDKLTDENKVAEGTYGEGKYAKLNADVINSLVDSENRIVIIGSSSNGLYGLSGKIEILDADYICGENLTWSLSEDKSTITISGYGDMYNYAGNTPWDGFKDQIQHIVIEDGATSIGNYAFFYCTGLISITIPDGVTSIGIGAFSSCSGLTSVSIPDSVTNIGGAAFRQCSGLTSITIPDGVTSISGEVFSGCSGLTNVTIPDSVTSIRNSAFADCSSLTSVTIPNGITSIDSYTFVNCSSLTSVTIPGSVTSIDIGAFSGCADLTDVYYCGTEDSWEEIDISDNNAPLKNATRHYHTWGEWEVTSAAGYTKTGTESRSCSVCKEVETREIPKLVSDYDYVINNVTAEKAEDGISVAVNLTKASDYSGKAVMILAAYKDGGLNDVELIDVSAVQPDETKAFDAKLASDECTVKVFIWDSASGLIPLCEAKEVAVQ